MKVVILAGGLGTRISEESQFKPKPMIEIGFRPILWHIMKYYYNFGFDDFIICCGYKSEVIKEYFMNYRTNFSDVTFDFSENRITVHKEPEEKWKVTLVETGLNTMTGGRLKRVKDYLEEDTFMCTYGDGVGNIDLHKLINFHEENNQLATVTAVRPEGRFGTLDISNGIITRFKEKYEDDTGWINAGFMVLDKKVIDYIKDDTIMLEREPFEKLAEINQMNAYKHYGFWQCMDTQRDKARLEKLWESGEAPWKNWI